MQAFSSADEPLALLKYLYLQLRDNKDRVGVYAQAGVSLNLNHYRLVDVMERGKIPGPPASALGIKRNVRIKTLVTLTIFNTVLKRFAGP